MNADALLKTLLVALAGVAGCEDPEPDPTADLPPVPAGASDVSCAAPVDGVCLPTDQADGDALAAAIGYTGLGSGWCMDDFRGPYQRPDETPTEGACCYVMDVYGCEGRPFVVGGEARTATVQLREDWC